MIFTLKTLMYGQVITAWLMIISGLSIAICTIFFNDIKKRAWIGYIGLFMIAIGVFVMLHYFVRAGKNMESVLRTLYEIYPQGLGDIM